MEKRKFLTLPGLELRLLGRPASSSEYIASNGTIVNLLYIGDDVDARGRCLFHPGSCLEGLRNTATFYGRFM
jgi:hypothetical protein